MNKIIAILGVIVLLTMGALFFCVGFFTGTTMPSLLLKKMNGEPSDEDAITRNKVDSTIAGQSENISDKIFKILALTPDTKSDMKSSSRSKKGNRTNFDSFQIQQDTLLKEIIAAHYETDDCSVQKTQKNMQNPKTYDPNGLRGKKVVFIGYFKDNIAFQIQKLLIGKGYKVHVEQSKTSQGESFVFCGPFKKTSNAEKLATWLQQHNFSEAKVMNITQEEIEETLYDSLSDGSEPPVNEEKEIPEVSNSQMNAMQNNAVQNNLGQSNSIQNNMVQNVGLNNAMQNPQQMNNNQNFQNGNAMPVQNYQQNGMNLQQQVQQMQQRFPQNFAPQQQMVPGAMAPQMMNPQQGQNMVPQQNVMNFR